jgi:hypothetical protein
MKKFLKTLSLIMLISSLAACAPKPKPIENIDFDEFKAEVIADGNFSDILSDVPKETAIVLYGLDAADVDNCVVGASTGATPEEYALFKAPDEAAANRISAALKSRAELQKSSFAS